MATIPLLEHDAQKHNQTAVSLGFLGHSFLYRISTMGVLYRYYHLFSQNFTCWHDSGVLCKERSTADDEVLGMWGGRASVKMPTPSQN